jgi:transposase
MLIIGCDYHPSMQQIAYVDTETGESGERRLMQRSGEAERFYRELQQRQIEVRVGMEATGYARWFERLLAELGFELWIGDPARIRARRVRKQKTDRKDAQLLLQLLLERDGLPRIWVPSPENRDLRQLLWHRHRLVQMRTRIMNQLQAVAMNEGLRRKRALWSASGRKQLESFLLASWATRRRQDLLEQLDRLNPTIQELTAAVEKEAQNKPEVQLLMSHPGVGPLTALAFVLIIGSAERFQCGKQMGSYLGLIPCEDSSADQQRLGHISKQFAIALFTGGSGSGRRTGEPGMASSVSASSHETGTEDRQGRHGAESGRRSVLDVAQAMGLPASCEIRFARGTARVTPWCAIDHRVVDWASRSHPSGGSSNK